MSVNVLSFFLYIQACVGPVSSVLSAHVGFAVSFRTYDTRSSSLVRLELRTAAAAELSAAELSLSSTQPLFLPHASPDAPMLRP